MFEFVRFSIKWSSTQNQISNSTHRGLWQIHIKSFCTENYFQRTALKVGISLESTISSYFLPIFKVKNKIDQPTIVMAIGTKENNLKKFFCKSLAFSALSFFSDLQVGITLYKDLVLIVTIWVVKENEGQIRSSFLLRFYEPLLRIRAGPVLPETEKPTVLTQISENRNRHRIEIQKYLKPRENRNRI